MFDRDFSKVIVDFENFEISQLGDALAFGGLMLLIGVATVFAVLCILWVCLTLFKVLFHDLPQRRAKESKAIKETDNYLSEATAAPTAPDAEIVAVIAAAIATAESESSGLKFRVVSFRRK